MATRVKNPQRANVAYFYGVTAKSAARPAIAGVDGKSPVDSIPCGDLLCWVSIVPRAEFADNLATNMENLDWLSEAGVRHQAVVSAIARKADILPARFGTVFLDMASLKRDVLKRKKVLLTDLRKIRGCDEWGVKVFSIQPKIQVPANKPASGREYLKNKATLLRGPSPGTIEDLDKFSSALSRIAAEIADGGRIAGGKPDLKWQSSLLIKRTARKRLEALLKKYSALWADSARLECTGPWPPYSFVSRG